MPDIALVICDIVGEMDHSQPDTCTSNEGGFKTPALPSAHTAQKQLRTIEWLQMDVEGIHHFDPNAMSHCVDKLHHVSDIVEVDFKELQKRSLSTSTPFIPRTSTITHLSPDSGIDTFSISIHSSTLTSYNSANDSLLSQSHGSSVDIEPKVHVSKFSDVDSAYGEGSHAPHDLSQDSQISECFSLDMYPGISKDQVNVEQTSRTKDDIANDSGDLQSLHKQNKTSQEISTENLSLPAPSWCSPVPTPPTMSEPKCTSTPKDSIQENIDQMLKHFSPSEPDRLIGRKMGLEYVDIVSELQNRSICCLQLVFRHLEPQDLCRSCRVSRQWNTAIRSDPTSLRRKKSFLKSQKLPCQKENSCWKGHRSKTSRGLTNGSSRLGAIQAVAEKIFLPTEGAVMSTALPPTPRHKLFWEEAKKCKEGESIRQCPRCASPSRVHDVQERAWCSNDKCAFDFCIRCNMPFHGAKDCSLSSPTKSTKKTKNDNIIGSKKSKKKLRRL